METRPRIKLELSQLDNTLEWTSKIFLVIMWGLTAYAFLKLPAIIPTHFNSAGQVDGYGGKLILLIVPTLATLLYFGLTKLNNYPHLFNYMTEITEDNAKRQYTTVTTLTRFMKLAILLLFSLLILFTYFTAIGVTSGLGWWFLPVTMGLLLIPLAISLLKLLKENKKVA